MFEKILDFMKAAGALALENYGKTDNSEFKSDCVYDIVTESDRQISRMFAAFAAESFSGLDYCVVDEETLGELGADPFDEIGRHEWQFVIDPIDGTFTYAMGMPMFGISVGVLRRGRPYWGAIYAPALGELVYGGADRAFWVSKAFTENENLAELKPSEPGRLSAIFDMDYHVRPKGDIDFSRDMPLNYYSAVAHFIYMATGRGRCYYFGAKIWDMAGAWAAMKLLGMEFIDYRTGEALQEFSAHNFAPELEVKSCHIVCRPKDFEYFRDISEVIVQ